MCLVTTKKTTTKKRCIDTHTPTTKPSLAPLVSSVLNVWLLKWILGTSIRCPSIIRRYCLIKVRLWQSWKPKEQHHYLRFHWLPSHNVGPWWPAGIYYSEQNVSLQQLPSNSVKEGQNSRRGVNVLSHKKKKNYKEKNEDVKKRALCLASTNSCQDKNINPRSMASGLCCCVCLPLTPVTQWPGKDRRGVPLRRKFA